MEIDSTDKLRSIRDDVIPCTQCDLYKSRTNPVIGQGNHDADIMFVGEAPGEEEDKNAMPFVGPAGKILDKLLAYIKLERKDVYITNTVKCRPPNNADPTDEQKKECSSYLTRQIDAIKPKIIVSLGNHATKTVMELFGHGEKLPTISKIHGELFKPDRSFQEVSINVGEVEMAGMKIMPLYHPAAMLHNPLLSQVLRSDFKRLKAVIDSNR